MLTRVPGRATLLGLIGESLERKSLETIDITKIARALRFLSLGNFLLLIVCGLEVVREIAMALFVDLDLESLLILQLGLTVHGYCVWVGWSNNGAFGAIRSTHVKSALLMLAVLSLIAALTVFKPPATDLRIELGTLSLGWSFLSRSFKLLAALFVLAALLVIRSRVVPRLGIGVEALLRAPQAGPSRPRRSGLRSPLRGAVSLAVGVAMLLTVQVVQAALTEWGLNPGRGTVLVLFVVNLAGFNALVYARHFFEPTFAAVASDVRSPILLLRSFSDDEKVAHMRADRRLFDFSLESRLACHFSEYGPFVAVGAPGDRRPHLGAIRAELSGDTWQEFVQKCMSESQVIVLMAGVSHWVVWELQQVIERAHHSKLVILFPVVPLFRIRRRASNADRLKVVREVFRETLWSAGLARVVDARRLRCLTFESDGTVDAVLGGPDNRNTCHFAAIVGHAIVKRTAGQPVVEPAAQDVGAAAIPGSRLARLRERMAATVIDVTLALAFLSILVGPAKNVAARVSSFVAIFILYHSVSEWRWGATVGKAIAGVKVTTVSGNPCPPWRALARNLARFIDGAGLYLVGLVVASASPRRQRVGDQVSGTVVVRMAPGLPTRLVLGGAWLVLCVAAFISLVREGRAKHRETACDSRDTNGCFELGAAYENVDGANHDYVRAVPLYQIGCDAHDARCCYNLGVAYEHGKGVAQNYQRAADLYELACNGGDPSGCFNLAVAFENGRGVRQDYARAAILSAKACEQHHAAGCFTLAIAHLRGLGVEQDYVRATMFAKRACEEGFAAGCYNLGVAHETGLGTERDATKAVTFLRKACDADYSEACFNLAAHYESADGVTEDHAQAVTLYNKACKGGVVGACFNLALKYENGNGVASDDVQAVIFYRKSCDAGMANGCYNLAVKYDTGAGVARDYKIAASLYSKACEGGLANGCFNLAVALEQGRGLAHDAARAADLFTEACRTGFADACFNLAVAYEAGIGVRKDRRRAAALYAKACTNQPRARCPKPPARIKD